MPQPVVDRFETIEIDEQKRFLNRRTGGYGLVERGVEFCPRCQTRHGIGLSQTANLFKKGLFGRNILFHAEYPHRLTVMTLYDRGNPYPFEVALGGHDLGVEREPVAIPDRGTANLGQFPAGFRHVERNGRLPYQRRSRLQLEQFIDRIGPCQCFIRQGAFPDPDAGRLERFVKQVLQPVKLLGILTCMQNRPAAIRLRCSKLAFATGLHTARHKKFPTSRCHIDALACSEKVSFRLQCKTVRKLVKSWFGNQRGRRFTSPLRGRSRRSRGWGYRPRTS